MTMKNNSSEGNRIINLGNLLIALGCLITLGLALINISCDDSGLTVDERLAEASEAIADRDYTHAQMICDNLAQYVAASDTTAIDEEQAAQLAMLFMMLSDQSNEDDNVAVATQCMRFAYSLSPDSLITFSQSLPLDEQHHFELLHRLTVSIDNPVDLDDEDFYHEEH